MTKSPDDFDWGILALADPCEKWGFDFDEDDYADADAFYQRRHYERCGFDLAEGNQ